MQHKSMLLILNLVLSVALNVLSISITSIFIYMFIILKAVFPNEIDCFCLLLPSKHIYFSLPQPPHTNTITTHIILYLTKSISSHQVSKGSMASVSIECLHFSLQQRFCRIAHLDMLPPRLKFQAYHSQIGKKKSRVNQIQL